MTKKFESLFPTLRNMSDEALQNHIGEVRRRRNVVRPAKAHHEEKAERPTKVRQAGKVTKLVGEMSPEDRAKLVALLEEAGDE